MGLTERLKTRTAAQDGGDGTPSHRTLPFLHSVSTSGGRSWSAASPLPVDMLSAQPKAAVLANGALLLTAGRPGVDLWVSADGFAKQWRRYSLPARHNELIGSEQHPTTWAYCDAFVSSASNHTFAGDPHPRVDTSYDGGPLRGFAQSSGYNAIVALEPDVGLVCYDRQGWGGGYVSAAQSVLAVSAIVLTGSVAVRSMALVFRLCSDRKALGRKGGRTRRTASWTSRQRSACASL